MSKEEIIKKFHAGLPSTRFQKYVALNLVGTLLNGALFAGQFSYWEKPSTDVVVFSSVIFHYDGVCSYPHIGKDGRETTTVTCNVTINECNKYLVSLVSIVLLVNLLFILCNVLFCFLISKSLRLRLFLFKSKLDISEIELFEVFLTTANINQWQILYQLSNFVDDATMLNSLSDLTDQTVQYLVKNV